MARKESAREDLLRESIALVERMELAVADWPDSVVIGFRRDGACSIYFGDEPVYQFNARGELRRAYVDGLLYMAHFGGLASLRRDRTSTEIQLVRHDLLPRETELFLETMTNRLDLLAAAILERRYQLLRKIPADADLLGRVEGWLAALPRPPKLARTARVHPFRKNRN